jgi:hypothetical protein
VLGSLAASPSSQQPFTFTFTFKFTHERHPGPHVNLHVNVNVNVFSYFFPGLVSFGGGAGEGP